jgi:hypothetical protein
MATRAEPSVATSTVLEAPGVKNVLDSITSADCTDVSSSSS